MLDRIKYAITHPVTVITGSISGALAAIGSMFHIPFVSDLWAWALASAPGMFTASSIFGSFVAPRIGWLPAEPFLVGAGGFGLIYGGHRLLNALKGLRRRIANEE